MTRQHIALYIDLLACFVFLPLVIMVLPMEKWLMHSVSSVLVIVTYVYVLYFIYRRIHLTQLVIRKKYAMAVSAVVILVLATTLLTYIHFDPGVNNLTEQQMTNRIGYRRQIIWFFFLIVSGFSLSIELAYELFRQIISKQEIESRKDKAELMLYKSQINPHFLFNTLNTLYALVISRSDNTESAFIKFSNILRYTYTQAREDMIPISQEMEYISQYVDLQKLRLNRHTQVDYVCEVDDENTLIPPMILITFIENAFKYGTSSEKDCTIKIIIKLSNGVLNFVTENAIMRKAENKGESIGLENSSKRLDLIYGERYSLDIDNKDNIYRLQLTIRIE